MKNLTKITAVLFLSVLIMSSCKKEDINTDLPECIEEQIMQIENNELENPPIKIWEWKVDGNTYYYFRADCCDYFNDLFDNQCNRICAPDGGFTGAGDGNCPEFTGEIEETLIWERE